MLLLDTVMEAVWGASCWVSSWRFGSTINPGSTIGSMREGIQGSVVGSWGSAVESVNSMWSYEHVFFGISHGCIGSTIG